MNRRLLRALLALYPRAWRDRYGAEVAHLTGELIAAGETTPLAGALNLMAGGVTERGRALAGSRRFALAMTAAAVLAVAGSLFATTHAQPEPTPASLTGIRCAFRSGSPDVALVPAGTKPGQLPRALVPVRVAEPRRLRRGNVPGESGPGQCVMVPALCRAGPGKPHRANVPVPVKPGQCVIAAPGLCRIAPGAAFVCPGPGRSDPGGPPSASALRSGLRRDGAVRRQERRYAAAPRAE